mmetsp:Transcript_25152/g.52594  ORF Transcript_25152/g.52594 Transcript_25152/m.52594 type:complete len:113 (+) Transcript_25152:284-622(+)
MLQVVLLPLLPLRPPPLPLPLLSLLSKFLWKTMFILPMLLARRLPLSLPTLPLIPPPVPLNQLGLLLMARAPLPLQLPMPKRLKHNRKLWLRRTWSSVHPTWRECGRSGANG